MATDQILARQASAQAVLPARPTHPGNGYDIYPTHDIGAGRIVSGHDAIAALLGTSGTVLLDGYPAARWDELRAELTRAWERCGVTSAWVDVRGALRPEPELDALVAPSLGGDDPLFGTAFTGDLADFFDPAQLASLHPDVEARVTVFYGPGAALIQRPGTLAWVEVPKNEIQIRARAGQPTNLACASPVPPKAAYKRSYFVDWPVLKRHKQSLLAEIDVLVDQQRPGEPTAIRGDDLRTALDGLVGSQVRARPWFEPGAWGGQWMKQHIAGLTQDVPNYAWSFELIVPENGVVLSSDGLALEVPFDTLLLHDHRAVLGESADRFGAEFPIRFDFLDTFAGGNLSIQVHPAPEYACEQFGERFTQDETYYILDCGPGAGVYLGFTDDINPDDFRQALEHSATTGEPVDIDRFVQRHPAARGDLFLIPNGTIHGSGVDNLVLEISATPYIFTFKLYDWVRPDLDGKPRPLNIDRGLANARFERKGAIVAREFISHPEVVDEGPGFCLVRLPTHPDHFYDVRRVELERGTYDLPTGDSVLVMSLVEGESVLVEAGGRCVRYHYAETFVVPAAANIARIGSDHPVKVVVASIKPGRGPR